MQHAFVETNWVAAYAAPAHHKVPAAVELLSRARAGELQLHLPLCCLTEARHPIVTKCQPRREADAIREFLSWASSSGTVDGQTVETTRWVLDQYEAHVRSELGRLPDTLASLRSERNLDIFPLNEGMLSQCAELAFSDFALKPFDQAVLAAVLVRARELWDAGEHELCFCELDGDLQPWDKYGNAKAPLVEFYEGARIWVYGDFELLAPERPADWSENMTADPADE